MKKLACIVTAASSWASTAAPGVAAPPLEYEVIAMLKDDSIGDAEADLLPGMEMTGDSDKDWEWREFERASIGDEGVAVFRSVGSTSFREGIWAGTPGEFELVGRVGLATAPGSDGVFDAMRAPSFDAGFVSFLGSSSDQTGSNGEIWSGPLGSPPNLLVSTGETAPGGGIFESFYPPSAQADGGVVFIGETDAPAGAGSDFGIYHSSANGDVQALLRANSSTPGFPRGGLIGNGAALISHPTGGIAFLTASTIYHVPDPAEPAPVSIIAVGDPAPGSGGDFRFLSHFTLNARGDVFFAGADTGVGPSFFSDSGIWKWRDGVLARVIRGGEEASAPGGGLYFESTNPSNTLYGRVCDAHGRVAVLAQAGDGVQPVDGRLGIWFGDESGIRLVCLEDELAPGKGATWRRPTGPTVSPVGHVGFQCVTDLPGGGRSEGIWVSDVDGKLFKLVEEGDEMMLRGKLRTIDKVRLNHGNDRYSYREQPINAIGQVVFSVITEDEFSFLIRAQIPFPTSALDLAIVDKAGAPQLTIPSRIGHSYQLETTTIPGGNWEDCGEPMVGDGGDLQFECPQFDGDEARYFRVQISPLHLPNTE